MKKAWLILLLLVSVSTVNSASWGEPIDTFSCESDLEAWWEKSGVSVSFPLGGIVAKVFEIPGDLSPAVKLTWTLKDTLDATLDCACPPGPDCCSGPEAEAFTRLTLYQVIAPPSDTIRPESGSTYTSTIVSAQNTREGGTNLCNWPGAVELSVRNYTGTIGITAGLDWLLTVSLTRVRLHANEICRCNQYPFCYLHNHPPVLHVPNQLVVPAGGTREFEVWGTDEDGDVRYVGVSEGAEVSYFEKDGKDFVARIRVPPMLESVRIQVADECGNRVAVERPVIVVHRPKLNICNEGWEGGRYKVQWEAFDEDLKTCAERLDFVEYLRFTYKSSAGEFTGGYDYSKGGFFAVADCVMHPNGRVPYPKEDCVNAYYTPPKDKKSRLIHLSIVVEDAWGFTDRWDKDLVNDPPDVDVSPADLKVKYGERVMATVTATDREGDQVVLEKDFGPGRFRTAKGHGTVKGLYTWVATSRQPWHLVRFSATDGYIDPEYSYAYLLIHVLQPPRAYDGM